MLLCNVTYIYFITIDVHDTFDMLTAGAGYQTTDPPTQYQGISCYSHEMYLLIRVGEHKLIDYIS